MDVNNNSNKQQWFTINIRFIQRVLKYIIFLQECFEIFVLFGSGRTILRFVVNLTNLKGDHPHWNVKRFSREPRTFSRTIFYSTVRTYAEREGNSACSEQQLTFHCVKKLMGRQYLPKEKKKKIKPKYASLQSWGYWKVRIRQTISPERQKKFQNKTTVAFTTDLLLYSKWHSFWVRLTESQVFRRKIWSNFHIRHTRYNYIIS